MPALPARLAWFATRRLRLITGFTVPVPRGDCSFHSHVHHELVLHRRGKGVTRVASGTALEFGPGQAVLYPAGNLHDQHNEVEGEDLCLHLDAGAQPPPLLRQVHIFTVPAALAAEMTALAAAPPRRSQVQRLALDLRASALVLALLDEAEQSHAAFGNGYAGLAARYLTEHMAEVGRIAEVARYVRISEDRLRHLFTATHGVGPLEYLTQLRIERARTLLQRSEMTLGDIASACGFATARYLCTLFRRRVGCSPGEWRRRSRLNRD